MRVRITVVSAVFASCFVACSAANDASDEPIASSDQELRRIGESSGPSETISTDAGVKDSGTKDAAGPFRPIAVLPIKTLAASCAPARWDIALDTRTCGDLPRTTSKGVWSAVPLFPDAPESFRDKHCAVTFTPTTSSCEVEEPYVPLELSCREAHSVVERSAACAADPAACTGSGSIPVSKPGSSKPFPGPICTVVTIDGGSPANNVPGCDSCGEISSGGLLYLSNPFNFGNIWMQTPNGSVQPLNATPNSSFVVNVGTAYGTGAVKIW